jgi:RNA-directed DNA polymerase
MERDLKGKKQLLHLWRRQSGKCPKCSERITKDTGWHVHHILPKAHGGSDAPANLALLHPNCRRQVHSHDETELLAPISRDFEEA